MDVDNLYLQIENLLKSFIQEAQVGTVEDLAKMGFALDQIESLLRQALDPIKETLRREALDAVGHKPGVIQFGEEGAQVTLRIPPPKMVLRKDAKISQLKTELGDQFGKVFQPRISYSVDPDVLNQIIESAPQTLKSLLLGSLEQTTGTVRVSFKQFNQ